MVLNGTPDAGRGKLVYQSSLVVRAILFKPDDKVEQYWID
jgi:hypothetical protein